MGVSTAQKFVAIMAVKILQKKVQNLQAKCYLFKKNVHYIFVTAFSICIMSKK